MKHLYVISLNNAKGQMQNFAVVADSRAVAEKEAARLAGVPGDTEPHTSQKLHVVDSVVE